jgi:hypothetical protein
MRRILLALALVTALGHTAGGGDNNTTERAESMKMRLKLENRVLTAT